MIYIYIIDSETNDVLNDAKMRVWNGESLINFPSSMWWVDLVKTTWRYGPLNLWRLDNTVDYVENCFKKIYGLQEEGVSFEYVERMFFLKQINHFQSKVVFRNTLLRRMTKRSFPGCFRIVK